MAAGGEAHRGSMTAPHRLVSARALCASAEANGFSVHGYAGGWFERDYVEIGVLLG